MTAAGLSLAHFSDLHLDHRGLALGPGGLRPKRLLSRLSWQRNRRHHHHRAILELLAADVAAHAPDQIAITGDLTNLSTPAELDQAAAWLRTLGDPGRVTIVPGNHDVLTGDAGRRGRALWRDWMCGDDGPAGPGQAAFPFVRRRGAAALIGLCSAVPSWPLLATGRLGPAQCAALAEILDRLGRAGCIRILLIHHPVAEGAASRRKALLDDAALRAVLARHGAELILHGHAHRARLDAVAGPAGPIPALSPPSASAAPSRKGEAARWHLIRLLPEPGGWRAEVTARSLNAAADGFETAGTYALALPAARLSSAA